VSVSFLDLQAQSADMGGLLSGSRAALVAAMSALAAAALSPSANAAATTAAALEAAGSHVDGTGRLQVDVHFDCAIAPPVAPLTTAGLTGTASVKAGTLCVVEGWVQPADLTQLDAVGGVLKITAPSYLQPPSPRALQPASRALERASVQRQSAALSIDQYGVSIMHAGAFVTQTGVSGAGVTVGVQSSGVYSLNTIETRGELPSSVQVLYPSANTTPITADEGTVLLEEVHAVAPKAKLAYCGPSTFVDFTSCMTMLINAGATILLDDTAFPSDGLMSQNNDQSSAIAQILAQNPNVLMLSSAGNNDGTYWEGTYSPVSISSTTLPALTCPSGSGTPDAYVATFGASTSQTLTVTGGGANFPLLLAWADPPDQITSRFDVFWFAAGSTTPTGCFSTAGNTTDQTLDYLSLPGGTYTVVVASPDASASGKFLKLWAGGDGLTTLSASTGGGLVSPQAMVPAVLTIGAVNGSDGVGDTIEPFSSSGPVTVQFPTVAQLQAPSLVAPDGITVDATGTYFASELFPDGNFYGTSAAVPNAGAVAALLRSAFPSLSVAQITTALEAGATALGSSPVPDDTSGFGRVDALGALGTIATPTISTLVDQASVGSASTSAQSFTVTGTGTLTFSVSSSNTALVPNSVVAAGTPGVTVSSGCGSTALTCTLSVTPVAGQAGTATVTISVLDGANRAAEAQLTLSSSNPAPATSSAGSGTPTPGGTGSGASTTASSGSHGGGGALQYWVLLWLGVGVALKIERQLQHA
jgi:Subtilase family